MFLSRVMVGVIINISTLMLHPCCHGEMLLQVMVELSHRYFHGIDLPVKTKNAVTHVAVICGKILGP